MSKEHKTMKLKMSFFVLFITFYSLVGARAIDIDALPATETVIIDGDLSDWDGALYTVDGEDVVIGVKYTDDMIYIALYPRTESLKRRLFMTGATVWINDTAKSKQRFGITFTSPDIPEPGSRQQPPKEQMGQEPLVEMPYEIINGTHTKLPMITEIKAAATVGRNRANVELSIPRKDLTGNLLCLSNVSTFSIGIDMPAGKNFLKKMQPPPGKGPMNGNDTAGNGLGDPGTNGPSMTGRPGNPGKDGSRQPPGDMQSENTKALLVWFRVNIK